MASQTEYAAHRGVSNNTISKWKRRGLLVFDADGGVNVEKSDEFVANHGGRLSALPCNPEVSAEDAGVTPAVGQDWFRSKAESERVRLCYEALLLQLRYDRESGLIAPIDDVVALIATEYDAVRTRCSEIGERVAARLVSVTSAEQAKAMIDADVVLALEELSSGAPRTTDFAELHVSVMARFAPVTAT